MCQKIDIKEARQMPRTSMRRASLLGIAFLFTVGAAPARKSARAEDFPRELETYVTETLREWDVPGAALAVVKDGRVLVAKGYGVREVGKPDRVDADTIFDTASLTKSFTAAAIATLVDEKTMSWDDPVRRYLPSLEFSDPYLTANVTIRDLLCHRTGVRRTNSAWYFTNVTRPQLLALVKNMPTEAPFRTRLVYWNIGYTIAGEAAAAAAGVSWEELVTRRLTVPLGMTRTTSDYAAAPTMGNCASGHELIAGRQQVTPRETTRASTAPAGAIQASVSDLARWMLFHLGDGSHDGRRILSAESLNEMHSAQIVGVPTPKFREARQIRYFPGYGLGWQVFDYRGSTLLWHSGNGDGQIVYMALLPELRLGVAILVNSWKAGPGLNGALASRIFDHYLGLPSRDYRAELREFRAGEMRRRDESESALERSRMPDAPPSLPLGTYAGVYRDRLGLDVVVTLEGEALRLRYGGGEIATLVPWHHDVFRVLWQNPLHAESWKAFATFVLDASGRVERLRMDPNGDEVDAKRVPD
jgi:CubicO group peptidase (beta-lactamase class C family)